MNIIVRKIGKYSIWIGLLLILAGFIYDIMFAGIPYQDPPEDLQIKYERNQKIASRIMTVGFNVTVIGGLMWLAGFLSQLWKKENRK